MLSDEEDNVFKISVPIITNEELERLDYTIENDLDNIVNQISETVSRDRDIIILKKVIEKQSKEIEELKKYQKYYEEMEEVNKKFIAVDKIKAKIEEYDDKGMTVNLANRSAGKTFQQAVHYEVKKALQSLLEKE